MRNVKQGKLPKPATDPVQVALAAIKQLPQETPRSSTYLKQVVEEAIKHPSKLALVEEAALAWGLSPVKALEMRNEAERAARDQMKPKGPAPGIVRVLVDVAERQWEEEAMLNSPERRGDWNPFSCRSMWDEEDEF